MYSRTYTTYMHTVALHNITALLRHTSCTIKAVSDDDKAGHHFNSWTVAQKHTSYCHPCMWHCQTSHVSHHHSAVDMCHSAFDTVTQQLIYATVRVTLSTTTSRVLLSHSTLYPDTTRSFTPLLQRTYARTYVRMCNTLLSLYQWSTVRTRRREMHLASMHICMYASGLFGAPHSLVKRTVRGTYVWAHSNYILYQLPSSLL